MGINMSKPETIPAQPAEIIPVQDVVIEEVKEFNIQADRDLLTQQLVDSKEVDDIVSTICVSDPQTIVTFGGKVAEDISKCSDSVLNSMDMSKINETGDMLKVLAGIMDKFDIDEIKEKQGIFQKIFGNAKKQLDKILQKYHTMGAEVDKIYIQLKQYESEIGDSNKKLEAMFQTNVEYYHELLKYILAGEQGLKELDEYIAERRQALEQTNDNSIQFELTSLEQAKMMLEQRVQDLRIAENVALQSIPMLKTMEFSNFNLVRKINSAFIITLPVFKQALSQAILLKRQRIQAEALSALDEKTNEMLIKNAQNAATQSKLTAQMASGSSIKVETLETTWKTIVNGISETQRIQEEASEKRKEDAVRLNNIKQEFAQMMQAKGNPGFK